VLGRVEGVGVLRVGFVEEIGRTSFVYAGIEVEGKVDGMVIGGTAARSMIALEEILADAETEHDVVGSVVLRTAQRCRGKKAILVRLGRV
jgi:hypothetical protein